MDIHFDVLREAIAFYSLETLAVRAREAEGTPSINRLLHDVEQVRKIYNRRLANLLADYCTLASLGEARHAPEQVGHRIAGLRKGNRLFAAAQGTHSDPLKYLPMCIELFEMDGWDRSFGGQKWKVIATVAYRWRLGDWSDVTFCDSALDLVHNGGLCFDKGYLVRASCVTQAFLTAKAHRPFEDWGISDGFLVTNDGLVKLLERGRTLGVLKYDCLPTKHNHRRDYIGWFDEDDFELLDVHYSGIEFGRTELGPVVSDIAYYDSMYEEEDEEKPPKPIVTYPSRHVSV